MTQSERVSYLFDKIRDYKVKAFGMSKQDAASDVQEFMRQCCRIWNPDEYEHQYMSDTNVVKMLKQYLAKDVTYYKENNIIYK
tara:strand:+ start:899 stop:1147 length:249 start_codon:yes stop_codon:yes gene_type:complete